MNSRKEGTRCLEEKHKRKKYITTTLKGKRRNTRAPVRHLFLLRFEFKIEQKGKRKRKKE